MGKEDVGLLRAMGGSVGKYLYEAFVDTDENQRHATARIERMYAFVDLMMLAILADEELLDAELEVLERRLVDARDLDVSIGEARARIRFKAARVDTPDKMRAAMKVAASRLTTGGDRALAYQLAVELQRAGSRLGVKRGGYRGNLRHDEGLLDLFAETLGIDDLERDRLAAAPLPAGFER